MPTIFSGDNSETDLPQLTSSSSPEETSNNQPSNVSGAVITTQALPPAAHESNKGFLLPPPPQKYHLLQVTDNRRPLRAPMIMANEGGFGQPIGQPVFPEELATSSSNVVSFGYQESYGNPFPPPLMHSGGPVVNQDQDFIKRFHAVSPLNPRIDDQHPYSSYDSHNLANYSSHAMNAPAAWLPSSSSAPDHGRFSMPNYSSDQQPEISPSPSTSHVAFAGAQWGQHYTDFVTAPTKNSLALQIGSHPDHEWAWDVDKCYDMEVAEDAIPLEIIDPSSSNGGVEHKKKKKQAARWTVDEHMAMLRGVEKYGKGRWKIIAREFVPSKSHVQLASHFQKYDARHTVKEETEGTSVERRRKKRKSIHDITLDDDNGSVVDDPRNLCKDIVEHDFEDDRDPGSDNGATI